MKLVPSKMSCERERKARDVASQVASTCWCEASSASVRVTMFSPSLASAARSSTVSSGPCKHC